jgi:RTX calcium-binding nonapeptide repeat (4 copies)
MAKILSLDLTTDQRSKGNKDNSNEKKQKTAVVVLVGAAAILAISAGFMPTIAMTAWAAAIQCQPAQPWRNRPRRHYQWNRGSRQHFRLGRQWYVDARGGNDNVTGGTGDDRLFGESGNDTLTGGPGADRFSCGDGTDTIIDFNAAGDTKTADCENFLSKIAKSSYTLFFCIVKNIVFLPSTFVIDMNSFLFNYISNTYSYLFLPSVLACL